MFKTNAFIFRTPGDSTTNEFGEEIIEMEEELVEGLLYSPMSTADLPYPSIRHDRIAIRIDIPKTYTKSLANSEIVINGTDTFLDGRIFKVVGDSGSYIAENTPGQWNRFITVQEETGNDKE